MDKKTAGKNALLERIRAAKSKRASKKEHKNQTSAPTGAAAAMFGASALISSIIVGLALGAGLDHLLGTTPFLIILLAVFGIAAGLLTVIRQANKIQADELAKQESKEGEA